ncbi:hypothetical protein OESDEN_03478 [Oesophagostomum dentatum]|uniref:Uncharacterized protein n=1 Tax=Oesophagostomum dentatum TaxID=61180 RepID=A0A0B1TG92_OESDE|nr:hypothetical protein OESDEN_03478 [Oesophagostomum dentatum]
MDDVIECLEKNISMVTARTTITKLYSPQRQKELYGISEYALSSIAVLWTMFCGVMICKLFHVICVVLLDMEVEDERD